MKRNKDEQRGLVIPRHFLDSSSLDDQGEPRLKDNTDVLSDPRSWPELSLDLMEDLLWLEVLD